MGKKKRSMYSTLKITLFFFQTVSISICCCDMTPLGSTEVVRKLPRCHGFTREALNEEKNAKLQEEESRALTKKIRERN